MATSDKEADRLLALIPGTRLGPYEILSALGAGGMGEVYRATDTTLGRQVAIKVLPSGLSLSTSGWPQSSGPYRP